MAAYRLCQRMRKGAHHTKQLLVEVIVGENLPEFRRPIGRVLLCHRLLQQRHENDRSKKEGLGMGARMRDEEHVRNEEL